MKKHKSAITVKFIIENKTDDKFSFRINENPKIVLNTIDFNKSFISMLGVRVEV